MISPTPFPFEPLSRRSEPKSSEDTGSSSKETREPVCKYTEDDLVKAVDEARCEAAGEVEARLRAELESGLDQRRCDLLAVINDQLERNQLTFDDELSRLACITQSLAVALAKAVVPRALEREPLVDITDALRASLVRLTAEPSLELRLPPDQAEIGAEIIAELAKDAGFKGEMTTNADPALGKGDAVLCWNGGIAERRLERVQAEALDLIGHWLQKSAGSIGTRDGQLPSSLQSNAKMPDERLEETDASKPVMSG